jgi:hypothetical protein
MQATWSICGLGSPAALDQLRQCHPSLLPYLVQRRARVVARCTVSAPTLTLVSWCLDTLSHTLEARRLVHSTRMHVDAWCACTWMPVDASSCTWMPVGASSCTWMPVDASSCTWMPVDASSCTWMPVGASSCTWMPVDASSCTWMPVDASSCTWMPVDASSCTWMPVDASSCTWMPVNRCHAQAACCRLMHSIPHPYARATQACTHTHVHTHTPEGNSMPRQAAQGLHAKPDIVQNHG